MTEIWLVTNSKYSYNERGNWALHALRPEGHSLAYCGRHLSFFYDQPQQHSTDDLIANNLRRGLCKQCLAALIREKVIAPQGRDLNPDGTLVG